MAGRDQARGAGTSPSTPAVLAGRDIIFETLARGVYARVAAVDVATGLEAHVQGPLDAPAAYLEQLALNKLARLLARQQSRKRPLRGTDTSTQRWV